MSKAIIIGDSTHNTLSIVRSLGIEKIPFILILKCEDDSCNVLKSKYVRRNQVHRIEKIDECLNILNAYDGEDKPYLICSFDEAAEWVDKHEKDLCQHFITPCRGHHLGNLFNKAEQCKLAEQCGLTVPKSTIFQRSDGFEENIIEYPLLLKPLVSTGGEKSDIHICHNRAEVDEALSTNSHCEQFIVQEFIDKEYELDCIGVATDDDIVLSGAVRKIRHYPPLTGAGAYGKFLPISMIDVDVEGVKKFIRHSGYHGPFSVEFIHTQDGRNYFMEINFRNEGLAFASTCAGANLHALYLNPSKKYNANKVRKIYMMNYSIDYLYVKDGRLSKVQWWRDFFRTRCFINMSFRDPMPVLGHYWNKLPRH